MKKNYYGLIFRARIIWKSKLLKGMKIAALLILITITQTFALDSYAQSKRLNLIFKNEKIINILDEIEEQSEFYFMFDASKIDVTQRKSIDCENQTITNILDQLFKNTGITYRISDRQIGLINTKFADAEQGMTISGKVTDSSGSPLPGVTIVVKGTTDGTVTNANGEYSLTSVSGDATLLFSFVGMKTQEILVSDRTTIDVTLAEESVGIDEVVAVGYATQRKESLTGSISSIKMTDEKRDISTSNLSSVLAGSMAGLRVNSSTGVPGVASSINIRTNSSWNSTPPVYVIDGVVREKEDFDRLDASEVDNISILKDAAATAIYGSRASGGVVLVTTKQGKEGKTEIRYSGSYAFETRGMEMKRSSGVQVAEMANYLHSDNPGHWTAWDQDEIAYIKTINNGWGYDVIDEYWNNPTSTHHSINISGGTDKIKYFVNGSYFGQNAFLENVDYHKYNLRANVEANVSDNLKIAVQLSNIFSDRDNITYGNSGDLSGIYTHMRCIQPYYSGHTSDGKPIDWGWIGNLGEFSNTSNTGYVRSSEQNTESLFRLEYNIPYVKGLKFKSQFSYNTRYYDSKDFLKKQTLYQVKKEGTHSIIWTDEIIGVTKSSTPSKETIRQGSNSIKSYQLNLQIDYARKFGKHDISAFAVYEQKEGKERYFNGGRENFPIIVKDQFFATSGAREDSWVDGSESENGRLSYIGQVNYSYDDKYLLSASMRVDGSMNFPKGNRYGYFPAISGGWIISKENFFHSDKIEMLKLRSSVGLTGNDNVIGWQWQESYVSGNSAYLGTTPSINPGIKFGGVINPAITWEKALSYNIGTDIYFLNHFNLTVDAWYRNTYDILGERTLSIPTSFGFTMPNENYGEVHAKGIDLELGYHNNIKDFKYNIRGTFSYSSNKVIQKDYPTGSPDYDNPIGRPLDYIVGYRDAGIIRTQEQLDQIQEAYTQEYGQDVTVFGHPLELGMLMYQDLSGPTGEPDGKIDSYDQDNISNYSTPPVSAGLTLGCEWKGFSVEALFQGDFKYKKILDQRYLNFYEWNRFPTLLMDHWSLETPNGYWPEPKGADDWKSYNATSTFTIKDASFVKMRYLNIAYNIPKRFLNSYVKNIGAARLFFNATNLFTITKFDYWDPELGSTGSYPNMKSFNFGVDVTF